MRQPVRPSLHVGRQPRRMLRWRPHCRPRRRRRSGLGIGGGVMELRSKNLGRCFSAAARPDKIALIDLGDDERPIELSYRDFDAECDAIARGLVRMGLRRGDRVGILSLNRHEVLAAFFGTMRAGMVTVPISFKLPPDIVAYIVRDAGLKAIVHDRA